MLWAELPLHWSPRCPAAVWQRQSSPSAECQRSPSFVGYEQRPRKLDLTHRPYVAKPYLKTLQSSQGLNTAQVRGPGLHAIWTAWHRGCMGSMGPFMSCSASFHPTYCCCLHPGHIPPLPLQARQIPSFPLHHHCHHHVGNSLPHHLGRSCPPSLPAAATVRAVVPDPPPDCCCVRSMSPLLVLLLGQ